MTYSLVELTSPAVEAVTRSEAKLHARVDWTTEDALFDTWVAAARRLAEGHTGRVFPGRTFRLDLPHFPCDETSWLWGIGHVIRLPVEPVSAVASVKYYATDGTLTTLADYQTQLGHSPPLIAPEPQTAWPSTETGRLAAVQVSFTAGYSVVPETAKAAMLMAIRYWAEEGRKEKDVTKYGLPPGAIRLLDSLHTGIYP